MGEEQKHLAVKAFSSSREDRDLVQKVLSEMLVTVSDKQFRGREVEVDGYRFINCIFEECSLRTARGTFEMHHCRVEGCDSLFSHESLKAVRLYKLFKETNPAAFSPLQFPDGTYTIDGVTLRAEDDD